ncbi:MAG: hypothetical protein AB7H77_03485, partial [Bdellovibrionales bacterium]
IADIHGLEFGYPSLIAPLLTTVLDEMSNRSKRAIDDITPHMVKTKIQVMYNDKSDEKRPLTDKIRQIADDGPTFSSLNFVGELVELAGIHGLDGGAEDRIASAANNNPSSRRTPGEKTIVVTGEMVRQIFRKVLDDKSHNRHIALRRILENRPIGRKHFLPIGVVPDTSGKNARPFPAAKIDPGRKFSMIGGTVTRRHMGPTNRVYDPSPGPDIEGRLGVLTKSKKNISADNG